MAGEVDAPPGYTPSGVKIGDVVDAPPGGSSSSAPQEVDAPPGFTSSGVKIGDEVDAPPGFKAPSQSKIYTSHDYDDIIRDAAKEAGIPEKYLRTIAYKETAFGTNFNYDAKTGFDRNRNAKVNPNAGASIFQIDPSSGVSPDVMNKIAADPKFAAKYAAGMFKAKLAANGGNVRDAFRSYNGSGPAAEAYADDAMAAMGRFDAPDYRPAVVRSVDRNVKRFNHAINHGDSAGQAFAKTDPGRPLQRAQAGAQNSLQWAQDHPIDAVLDVFGGVPRGIGGFEEAASKGENLKQVAAETWHDIIHPNDKANQNGNNGARDLINMVGKKAGASGDVFPTPQDLKIPTTGVLGAAAPTLNVIGGTSSDVLSQLLAGGFTEIDGLALKGVANTIKFATTQAARIPQARAATDALGEIFRVRNDLHKAGFTQEGKGLRLAIENVALNNATHMAEKDIAASNDGKLAQKRMLEYAYNHGDKATSAQAAALLKKPANKNTSGAMSVKNLQGALTTIQNAAQADRGKAFQQLRNMVTKKEIQANTLKHVASDPKLFTGDKAAIKDLETTDASNFSQKSVDGFSQNKLGRWFGNLEKRSITWNPAAHGIKNVGTLTYLAGGEEAVKNGISYMTRYAKTGIPNAIKDRLEAMGATQHYMDKGGNKWTKASTDALEHMEMSWRAGMLDVLDKKLGPSQNATDELKKGALILHKLGDYRNLNAFVKVMQGLGAPFAVFRDGIIPARIAETAIHNPERLMSVYRAKQTYQNNRADKKRNRYVAGDPTDDTLTGALKPVTYLSKSLGAAGLLVPHSTDKNKGFVDHALDFANAAVPAFGSAMDGARIAAGNFVHNETSSPLNRVFQSIHSLVFGGHNEDIRTAKQEAAAAKIVRKKKGD